MSDEADRDSELLALLENFRRVPDTPRESIWVEVVRGRRAPKTARRASSVAVMLAASVVLFAAGVFTGKALAGRRHTSDQAVALTTAMRAHLAAADSLITLIRLDVSAVHAKPMMAERARTLLAATRALEESATVATALNAVLRDLDLVLEQIAQYSSGTAVSPREGELIQDAITERRLTTALRSALDGVSEDPRE